MFGNGKWEVDHWSFFILSGRVWYTQSMYTIVLCLLYFPLIICIVLCSLIALFPNAGFMCKLTIVYWSTWREKKGTLILTFWLESRGQNDELRMRPQISRGAVKEQTRLSRSSDIIPVLQVKTQIKRETNVCSTAVALLQCMDKGKVLIVMQFENCCPCNMWCSH